MASKQFRHARIQEFWSGGGGGGGPGQTDKKCSDNVFVFLVHSLFYRSQMVNSKKSIIYQGSRGGVQHFSGGSNFFQGGPIAYSL